MKKNSPVPSPALDWDVAKELDTLRIELQEDFSSEKERLLQELKDAKLRLDDLSSNTLKKTENEWVDYETQLKSAEELQVEKIKSFKVSLSEDLDQRLDLTSLSLWVFRQIMNMEE